VQYRSNFLNAEKDKTVSSVPAGSNYDLIIPETGVTIIEGTKKKAGDRDYYKKFQKYSKYDYNTMLKDASVSISNISRVGKSLPLDDPSHSQISLPQINQSRGDLNTYTNIYNNNSILNNSVANVNTNRLGHSYNFMDSIKLSNKLTMSLKSTLDALDLIPEYDEKICDDDGGAMINNYGGNILINSKLGKNNNEYDDKESLEAINKFNYSILRNTYWGSSAGKGGANPKGKKHFKPDQKELEKEMGLNILNTKLPRSRVFNLKNKNK
jgi:hypothetical protein